MMTLAFLFAGSLSFYLATVNSPSVRAFVSENYRSILAIMILNLVIKYPLGGILFGLEYEDAYIYQSAARHLL